MPKLKGKTLAQAKQALTKSNCKLGKVTKKRSAEGEGRPGQLDEAGAGKAMAAGTKVNLVVTRH